MHNNKYYIHNRGFTLIELLTVIAITTLLSLAGYAMFQNTQKNSRDQQRKSDLAKIQSALATYSSRKNRYPDENYTSWCDSSMGGSVNPCAPTGNTWDFTGSGTGVSDLKDLVDEGIISSLPVDPKNKLEGGNRYLYHIELDKYNQGSPACLGSGNTTCRYILQTLLENGELYAGGRGICIYSIIGGSGNPQSTNFSVIPPSDCEGNIVPTGWTGKPCCKQ